MHTFHTGERIMVAAPYDDGAVFLALDGNFDREKRCGAVMLRPVEFDPARDPGAGKADQRRLDDILAVEEVVAVDLVLANMNAATDLGQDHEAQIFVFEVYGLPGVVAGLGRDAVDDGQRIDLAG